ncbi:MAG: copper chaperone PCu(A)C [Anaerolineae bacterium]
MKIKLLAICLILVALFVPMITPTSAHGDECEMAYMFNGYARATPPGAPTGAVFGLVVNLSAAEDTLVSVDTDVAEVAELHEMMMGDNDVMQMRPVEGGFVIAPHDFVELMPGGYHIMLVNLKQELVAGEMLALTLHFEHAGDVALSVPIKDMTAMEDGAMGGMDMGSMNGMSGDKPTDMSSGSMDSMPMDWGACAGMQVVGAWARPTVSAMPNSAAYALLVNLTDKDDVLVSAETTVADAVELHEMTMGANDVMQMRPIEGGIPVPAGAAVRLQPGGLHVMLIGLTQELAAGTTMHLKLNFAESDSLELDVPIHDPVETGMSMPMSGG